MKMKLGYFQQFKGADTVLLDGSSDDIRVLIKHLSEFVKSSKSEIPIHEMSHVSKNHPAMLYASSTSQSKSPEFHWLVSSETFEEIEEKLCSLANTKCGHQYFELRKTPVLLMVSVGEHDESWWCNHG